MYKKFKIINNELYELEETFIDESIECTTVSYIKVLDYKLYKSLIEEVIVEHVIEIDKYLKKEEYLSAKRVFREVFSSEIKTIVNIEHQRRGGSPLIV